MQSRSRWFLYLLSLSPLLVALGLYNLPWGYCPRWSCIKAAIPHNPIALVLLAVGLAGLSGLKFFRSKYINASTDEIEAVASVEDKDFEMLTFLFTYIVPLIAFGQNLDLDHMKDFISFVVIGWALGYLYVRTDLYMSNPVLLYFGLHLYKVHLKQNEPLTVLCREQLVPGDLLKLSYLGRGTAIAIKHTE